MNTKKKTCTDACVAFGLIGAFVLWTLLVCFVDVRGIGPDGSAVGLATWNAWFHDWTGVHMTLYVITDWLGLVPVAVGCGFAILGLVQWMKRKRLRKVDGDLLALGALYLIVLLMYLLFETVVINYRPVRIDGYLEASYPSSTTLLVLCVMPTAAMQLRERLGDRRLRHAVTGVIGSFVILTVVGRLLSGVHWISDIVGGGLLSTSLVYAYRALCNCIRSRA